MTGMTLFKLCQRASGTTVLGLSCDEDGIFLAGEYALAIPITDATGHRVYRVRPLAEINVALSAAYGRPVDFSDRMVGLRLAAPMSDGRRMGAGEDRGRAAAGARLARCCRGIAAA